MASGASTAKFDTFIEEKYLPLDGKVKALIAIAAVLVPIALFYFLVYRPADSRIEALKKQAASMHKELQRAQKAARDLPRYEREMAETRQRFEATSILLPRDKEIPALLRNISDLGKGAGLDFLSFKPGKEIPKDFYSEIPVDISIRGPYHNMGFFLDQVSKLDRIVTVNNIKMGSPKQDGGEMLLNSTCRLVTYRFTNTESNKAAAKKKNAKKKAKKK
ncbi:MAG TPA: pilus assembly protein PilO [Desulfobulbus sp.]|nr:pilus assembly protein PilO [Desulfobulbus sp.]